jgi:hypothetical protein
MSMFTPVGMGGQRYGRGPRRRRWPAVLLVVALLGAGAGAAWWLLDRGAGAPARAVPRCPAVTPTPAALMEPGKVTVNVYNASDRYRLAAKTATRLEKQGYAVGKIDNDPLKRAVTTPAEVRHGEKGLAQARTVLAVAPDAALVQDDRTGERVDLVLGGSWGGFADAPEPPMVTPPPRPGCDDPTPRAEATEQASR